MADFNPERGFRPGASLAGAGLQFAIAVILFVFLGQWLDKKFGTAPVFLLLCVFAGAGAALYSMYRKVNAINAAEDEARKKDR